MLSKNLLLVAAAIVPAFAQDEEEASSAPNITALIESNDQLSTLGTILETFPDVASSLADAMNVTLFAPTNDAFESFLEDAGMQLEDVTSDMVAAILNYHVIMGAVMSDMIADTPTFAPTLLENTTYTNVTGGQVISARLDEDEVVITSGLKSEATVVEADIEFSGGIAHVIDAVNVIPMNISSTASDANLTYFLGALAMADLASMIEGMPDVTIFAPSNSAFESIGSAFEEIETEMLVSILQAHVINGTIAYSSSIGNGSVETLSGEANLTVAEGAVFVNQARVVTSDILVANGVIHVIDSVLNPNGTVMADPESDDAQVAFEGASSVASLDLTSGVPEATTTNQNLVSTTAQVADGFTPVTEGAVGEGAGGAGASEPSETSEEAAAMVTGAVGMAALFGGAAFVANM